MYETLIGIAVADRKGKNENVTKMVSILYVA